MATYNFSALSSGQAIAFNPATDVLFFDQTVISARNLTLLSLDSGVRVAVRAGADAGKYVDLMNTRQTDITTSNVTFANGSRIFIGDVSLAQNDNASNTIYAGSGNDYLDGYGANDFVNGGGGNDWLLGAGSNDTLAGSGGQDSFVFNERGGGFSSFLPDFATNWDNLQFNTHIFPALGSVGRFAAGDGRFWSAAGATSGHDADDRLIFNTSTRQLFYDEDGSGPAAPVLLTTLGSGRTVNAADIWVYRPAGTDAPTPPPSGQTIYGTAGDDSLVGGAGNDTMYGYPENRTSLYQGNDTLVGNDGNDVLTGLYGHDSLVGGAGNDTMYANVGSDTLIGGAGDDELHDEPDGNGVLDGGDGIDTFMSQAAYKHTVNLQAGTLTTNAGNVITIVNVENVILLNGDDWVLGNSAANRIVTDAFSDTLDGAGGNDTLTGGADDDHFMFTTAPDSSNADVITDFASGVDKIHLDARVMAALGSGGNFASGDARFYAAPGANAGHDADDRVVYNTSSGQFWYDADGSGTGAAQLIATLQAGAPLVATDIAVENGTSSPPPPPPPPPSGGTVISGTAGNDSLEGGTGNDTMYGHDGNDSVAGAPGNDLLYGNSGSDWVFGGNGNDTLSGGGGQDAFVFGERGAADADRLTDYAGNWDSIRLDDIGFGSIGATGRFASGDARFWAAAGANSGHDATDRIVFNTSTGQLWYDRDGSGSFAAELIATVPVGGNVLATDIYVF